MPRVVHSPTYKISAETPILPIHLGGTSARTPEDAAVALGAVSASSTGQPRGPVPLINGQVDARYFPIDVQLRDVTLTGPLALAQDEVGTYTITNYDFAGVYALFASNGTVVRDGATVTYTAPSTTGVSGFTINGKLYSVTVTGTGIAQPQLTLPANNTPLCNYSQLFTTAAFNVVGGVDTHAASSWELATDPAFTTIFASIRNSSVNKTSWSVNTLQPNTAYYVRVSHHGTTYGASAWSSTVAFTTKPLFYPASETNALINGTVASGSQGTTVSISADGLTAVVGAPGEVVGGLTAGVVTVYQWANGFWTVQQTLTAAVPTAGARFGAAVALSANGQRIVVGAPGVAAVTLYRRVSGVWTLIDTLTSDTGPVESSFGCTVAVNATGTRVAIGAPTATATALANAGCVYVFTDLNGAWEEEYVASPSVVQASAYFGTAVALSGSGARLLIGAPGTAGNAGAACGAAYVFTYTAAWAETMQLIANDTKANDQFGTAVALNDAGTLAAVGAPMVDSLLVNNSGAVYVFTGTDAAWIQSDQLHAMNPGENARFGAAVALNALGDVLIVAAPLETVFLLNAAGCLFAFTRTDAVWTQQIRLTLDIPDANVLLGTRVSLDARGVCALAGVQDSRVRAAAAHVFQ